MRLLQNVEGARCRRQFMFAHLHVLGWPPRGMAVDHPQHPPDDDDLAQSAPHVTNMHHIDARALGNGQRHDERLEHTARSHRARMLRETKNTSREITIQ